MRALELPAVIRTAPTHAPRLAVAAIFLLSISSSVLSSDAADEAGATENYIRDAVSHYGSKVEQYMPEFLWFDRSIIGRASDDVQVLSNNQPGRLNIDSGDSQFWTYPSSSLSAPHATAAPQLPSEFDSCPSQPSKRDKVEEEEKLEVRQQGTTLYVSLNTCIQPTANSDDAPGQLELYISTSSSNQKPSASQHNYMITVNGGFASWNLSVTGDVFFGITAPSNQGFHGPYNYELTASIDGFYANFNDSSNAYFVDSDSSAALIFTNDTTTCDSSSLIFQEWMNASDPFTIFVQNQDDPSIQGLQNSMCALNNLAQVRGSGNYDTNMTLTGGGRPKQLFHVRELNATSSYYAIVGLNGPNGNASYAGPGKVGGGGTVWSGLNFTTKSAPNCALIYGLDFCTDVAYAVPANPGKISDTASLRAFYDSTASSFWTNFTYSMAQVPCNTTPSAQYSLVVGCDNCTTAYKDWLCAVTIPRCEDFSNSAPYLLPRAVGQPFINDTYGHENADDPSLSSFNQSFLPYNSSRNPYIDSTLEPGPYKELLPCADLCYRLVRNCPASMGFVCPTAGHGLNYSYGERDTNVGPGQVSCNDPSADHNAASALTSLSLTRMIGIAVLVVVGMEYMQA